MPIEIERKFLVVDDGWRQDATGPGRAYRQGYLGGGGPATVRIRRAGPVAYITVKGPRRHHARAEFEYPIPVEHAEELLSTVCADAR